MLEWSLIWFWHKPSIPIPTKSWMCFWNLCFMFHSGSRHLNSSSHMHTQNNECIHTEIKTEIKVNKKIGQAVQGSGSSVYWSTTSLKRIGAFIPVSAFFQTCPSLTCPGLSHHLTLSLENPWKIHPMENPWKILYNPKYSNIITSPQMHHSKCCICSVVIWIAFWRQLLLVNHLSGFW